MSNFELVTPVLQDFLHLFGVSRVTCTPIIPTPFLFFLQPKIPQDIVPVSDGTIVQRNTPSHHALLNVENPSFPARTSLDWLKQHGLKGESFALDGLNLRLRMLQKET